MIQARVRDKGEIVIPKPFREQIGITENSIVYIEVEGKRLVIEAAAEDVIKRFEECAKRSKADVSKWVYGDKLYEEIFSGDKR